MSDFSVSFSKVKDFYEKAGELGLGEAYSRLAEEYAKRGEWESVRTCYQKAAELDHAMALYCLAIEARNGYFDFGHGIIQDSQRTPDEKECFRLMKKAAKLDHVIASTCVGCFYKEGYGVEESNPDKAVKWFRKSAEKGDPMGMKYLGEAYKEGYGSLAQDDEQAMYWLGKAADNADNDPRDVRL